MKKITRHLKQVNEIRKYTKFPDRYYIVQNPQNPRLNEAKRLQADIYLNIGFVDHHEIGRDGKITLEHDPHQEHAEYFIVVDSLSNSVISSARHIVYSDSKEEKSFPIFTNANLHKEFKQHLKHADLKRYVEVSGLVKKRGASTIAPLLIYREMLKKSILEKHDRWLIALDVNYYKKMTYIFGNNLQIIGDITSYKGGDIIPLTLEPSRSLTIMENDVKLSTNVFQKQLRKNFLNFFKADKTFLYEHEKQQKRI